MIDKTLLPADGLALFGGIRDGAPDAWDRRVIEAKLKVPANSLPESQYRMPTRTCSRRGRAPVGSSIASDSSAG